MEETKICTKCENNLPATSEYFHKQKNGKYGLKPWCKVCTNEYMKKYWGTPKYKEKNRNRNVDYRKKSNSDKKVREGLSPSYIARSMRISVKDLTNDIIETKRNIIMLKRELKKRNIKIS